MSGSTRISRCVINRPVKNTAVWVTKVYQDDFDYLKEQGIPIGRALRIALHEYVIKIKQQQKTKPNFISMTREERDAWIMSAPNIERPVPQRPAAVAVIEIPKVRESVPDMTGWTKADRDAWILSEGKILPARPMMVKRTGAQV